MLFCLYENITKYDGLFLNLLLDKLLLDYTNVFLTITHAYRNEIYKLMKSVDIVACLTD